MLMMFSFFCFSQEINNSLYGYYEAKSETSTYLSLEFDGNGKVTLTNETSGDYFTIGDMLLIYTDKENFRFKIVKNKLIGLSNNIKKNNWIKSKKVIPNNRTNNIEAKKIALLMNDYYKIMGIWSLESFTSFNYKNVGTELQLEMLCVSGLPLACLSQLKLKLIDDLYLNSFDRNEKTLDPKPENAKIISLAHHIIEQKDYRAYSYLGLYYYKLGQKEKAMQQWKLGAENGDKKSSSILIDISMENDPDNKLPIIEAPTQNKKN